MSLFPQYSSIKFTSLAIPRRLHSRGSKRTYGAVAEDAAVAVVAVAVLSACRFTDRHIRLSLVWSELPTRSMQTKKMALEFSRCTAVRPMDHISRLWFRVSDRTSTTLGPACYPRTKGRLNVVSGIRHTLLVQQWLYTASDPARQRRPIVKPHHHWNAEAPPESHTASICTYVLQTVAWHHTATVAMAAMGSAWGGRLVWMGVLVRSFFKARMRHPRDVLPISEVLVKACTTTSPSWDVLLFDSVL